jgi:TolB-like protein
MQLSQATEPQACTLRPLGGGFVTGDRAVRRLAAIVVADVVGYSRLIGADEAGTLARLAALRREIVDHGIARHSGRVFKETGDGFLVEFSSAVQAVTCAMEIQKQVEARACEGEPLRLRIGIHVGDVVVQDDDLMGDGVNIAARIESIADPGGIAVSRAVYEQVRDRLTASFDDRGEIELKNISRPVHIYAISGGKTVPSPVLALRDKPSIAVLPFQNMSDDPEQEYFADGIVEDIITALSRISWFFVIARNSSFTYKGRAVDVRQAGRELGARYIVEGSVRKAGKRLRISGQLVDTASGNHIWADRFDGALEDVFDLQDKITSNVVGAIEPRVQQAEIRRAQAKSTDSLSAYDLYLRALVCVYKATEESINDALLLTERAIAADRQFSSAYGLKAICHVTRKAQGWGPVEAAEAHGLQAARLAVETGKDDPTALARGGLAMAYLGGNHREGLAHVERALALNPNLANAMRLAGYISWYMGEHERSLVYFEQARRFSPVDPTVAELYAGMGFPYFFTGRYEEAARWADRSLRERPNWAPTYWLKLAALASADVPREELRQTIECLQAVNASISRRSIMRRFPRALPDMCARFDEALRKAGLPD